MATYVIFRIVSAVWAHTYELSCLADISSMSKLSILHIWNQRVRETTADPSFMSSFCSRSSPHWAWIWQDKSSGCPIFHRKCCSNMMQLDSAESTCIADRRSYEVFGKLHLDFPSILCKQHLSKECKAWSFSRIHLDCVWKALMLQCKRKAAFKMTASPNDLLENHTDMPGLKMKKFSWTLLKFQSFWGLEGKSKM